ncbi:MAG: ABC transporter permease [Chthoniobacter sp.]
MNRVLLEKELQALRPFVVCILGLSVLSWIYTLCTKVPDAEHFDPAHWLDETRGGSLLLLALFSLLLGAGVLMQESDQRTLLFLDGLPVSRTRVFLLKTLAALLVIALLPLLDFGTDVATGLLSRTSTDGPFPWTFIGAEIGLLLLAAVYLVALAMLVSFTRAWFALVTGLLLWIYLWLRGRGVDWLAFFDTYALLGPSYTAAKVLVSWRHVAVHAAAAIVSLFLAWLGFLSLGDRTQFAAERLGRLRWLAALGVGARWLAPVIWIAAFVKLVGNTGSGPGGADSPIGEEAFSQRETKHYEFLYRTAQTASAKPLLAAADHVYEQVAAYLGAPSSPTRVVVDLASAVATHASGQTNWTKIRIPLQRDSSLNELNLILGHETTHVFIEQLSDGRLSSHFNEIRFLHEGLATHVELQLFGTNEDRAQNRRSVAGAWSRGKVPLELLMDDAALRRQREPNLAYPLGDIFAQALIETQGHEAPARLLRAFARRNAPSGLEGAALWRDTMQAAGLSLDRVAAAYDVACSAAMQQEKDFLSTLPRLAATVRIEQENIVVQPIFAGLPPPGKNRVLYRRRRPDRVATRIPATAPERFLCLARSTPDETRLPLPARLAHHRHAPPGFRALGRNGAEVTADRNVRAPWERPRSDVAVAAGLNLYSSVLSSRFSRRITCFFTTSTFFVSSKSAFTISALVGSSARAGSSG